jgi:Fe2+ transport system protein FeoA
MLNLLFWKNNPALNPPTRAHAQPATLAGARPGRPVTIRSFDGLPTATRQHLQAYGVLPGHAVYVLARRPVTILLVEQTELALESEIARHILVDPVGI